MKKLRYHEVPPQPLICAVCEMVTEEKDACPSCGMCYDCCDCGARKPTAAERMERYSVGDEEREKNKWV